MQELYRLFFKTVAEVRKEQEIQRTQKAVLLNPARTQGYEHDESAQLISVVT
jgi:ribosomal protein L15E